MESDFILTVDAINGQCEYMLEVGHVIDQYKNLLHLLADISVKHIDGQVNKIAHSLVKMPCNLNRSIFMSFRIHLVEARLMFHFNGIFLW